jgi:hypothetical protein
VGLSLLLLAAAGCTVSNRGLTAVPGSDDDGGPQLGTHIDGPLLDPTDGPLDRPAPDAPLPDKPRPDALDGPGALGLGIPCTAGGQPCMSGFCVDGFCCENGCAGACQACAASKTGGANGRCRPVSGGTDPDSECSDEGAATCKRNGECDGAGSCALYPKGSVCGGSACAGSTLTPPPACDGAGTCQATAARPCVGGFVCENTQTCKTGCAGDRDCVSPLACDTATGFCSVMKKDLGQACGADPECASGTCADGVCCDRACGGRCRACLKTLTGVQDGTCADVMAGVRPTRQGECQEQRETCGNNGLCDGAGGCQQWPDGTRCGSYCCNGGPGSGANFCHLQCAGGSCSNRTGQQAGSCDDSSPCTRDRCNDGNGSHTCSHDPGCGGLTPCCCVGATSNPFCADATGCTAGLGGTCAP